MWECFHSFTVWLIILIFWSQVFDNIECEWPVFWTYLMLDGIFNDNKEQVDEYKEALDDILVTVDGVRCVPELYTVPSDKVKSHTLCLFCCCSESCLHCLLCQGSLRKSATTHPRSSRDRETASLMGAITLYAGSFDVGRFFSPWRGGPP